MKTIKCKFDIGDTVYFARLNKREIIQKGTILQIIITKYKTTFDIDIDGRLINASNIDSGFVEAKLKDLKLKLKTYIKEELKDCSII